MYAAWQELRDLALHLPASTTRRCPRRPKGFTSHGVGATGSPEPPVVGAGNQTGW